MEHVEPEPRLSQMSTHWTALMDAQSGAPDQISPAVSELMCRYSGAVHRYFLKAVKNPGEAEELDQEFAVRFLRGDFRGCKPERGRFRDYVKRSVQNMISDHFRRKKSSRARSAPLQDPASEDPGLSRFDKEFLASWRSDLLDRSWQALAELEKTSGQPYHTVLRFRVEHPELPSVKAAEHLSRLVGRPLTGGAVRQAVQRSRKKFVDFLLAEVLESLDRPSQDELEEELGDLDLLQYCRPYISRRAGKANRPGETA
jgi:RNA polymerase sigma factor (sigma-70 family)